MHEVLSGIGGATRLCEFHRRLEEHDAGGGPTLKMEVCEFHRRLEEQDAGGGPFADGEGEAATRGTLLSN
jgi:hypothetical protein